MTIEEKKNELILRFSKEEYSPRQLRDILQYLEFIKIAKAANPVTQEVIDQLAEEANEDYWAQNKERFDFLK